MFQVKRPTLMWFFPLLAEQVRRALSRLSRLISCAQYIALACCDHRLVSINAVNTLKARCAVCVCMCVCVRGCFDLTFCTQLLINHLYSHMPV
jgi:hypothetical protein